MGAQNHTVPNQAKTRSRWSISLRTILLLMTAAFVIGYQQYQIRRMQERVTALQEWQADQAKTQTANTGYQVIWTQPSRPLKTIYPFNNSSGALHFPPEVERAMMGDAMTPQATSPPVIRVP